MVTLAALLAVAALGHPTQQPAHDYTLQQAHAVAAAYETGIGTVGPCHWVSQHDADCPVVTPVEIAVTDVGPIQFEWTDLVTRYGGCSVPVTAPGIASGTDTNWHGCYGGPLMAVVEPATLKEEPLV